MRYTFTYQGNPKSSKNSRPIFRNRMGMPFIGKSKELVDAQREALWELIPQKRKQGIKEPLACKLHAIVTLYRKNKRNVDLVNLLQLPCDLLQASGIIENDYLIASVDGSRILYDKENPRTEITITDFH